MRRSLYPDEDRWMVVADGYTARVIDRAAPPDRLEMRDVDGIVVAEGDPRTLLLLVEMVTAANAHRKATAT